MRCRACNAELNDIESTRKDSTGDFIDLCGECLGAIRQAQFEDDLTINEVVSVVADEEM